MSKPSGDNSYVTTRELASELRSMRWEFRFLVAMQSLALLGVGYKLNVPGVEAIVSALPLL
jgi:hypothetical protein